MIPCLRRTLTAVVAVGAVAGLAALVTPGAEGRLSAQEGGEVSRVLITGTIEMGLAPFVERALDEAAERGAAAVVLDLDTPGGRVDAAWQIIDAVRDASLPVYAYVNRRALSAGAMIALSADALYMRSGSTIGAATPVTGEGEKASEKMVSALRSEFRALAEERGFDPRLAEAMVDESVEVPGVSEAGKLLTLTTEEATELGVAAAETADYPALLEAVDLEGSATIEATPNWAEKVVRFLTNPAVAPMLLSLGFLGLLIEIRTPAFGIAGAVGLGALAAFFGAHHLVNLAGLEEILLVGIGVVLIVAEVFVIPGFGVAGILGTGALLGGTVLGMVGQFPSFDQVFNAIGLVSLSLILVGVSAWALLRHLPKSRRLEGVFLRESTSRETGYLSAPEREDLVGRVGVAATDLRPAGTALVDDERIDVVTEGPWIEADTPIRVVQAESYRHVVRAVDPQHEQEPPAESEGGAETTD
ncbi:MAG: ATP-dependent Clp protease proteolytic subunit [Gemmatimonadetes bacterium]|nr:ATP-dependent Clp protease proteolytic subunit [Gemmatimonadota bacterium]